MPPCLPPLGARLLLRAALKRPHRSPHHGPHSAGAGPSAPLMSEFLADAPRRSDVERYNAALGFAPGSTPLTYYYLLVQRAHLVTMLAPAFPHRLAGMVHLENALVLHGAPPPGAIRLSTRIQILPPSASGAVVCALDTEGRCGDALLFTCSSRYLAVRGQRRGGAAPAPAEAQPEARPLSGSRIAEWTLAPSCGRAYARVSGDWNPIHLTRWTARLMGLRAPIIHGMHSVGKAAAQLERASGRRVTAISTRFRAPVPLGATVVLAQGAEPDTYALTCAGRLAAEGSVRLA